MKQITSFKKAIIMTITFLLLYIFFINKMNMSLDTSNPIRKIYFITTPLLTSLYMFGVYKRNIGKKKYFWLIVLIGNLLYSIGMSFHSLSGFSYTNQQNIIQGLSNLLFAVAVILFIVGFLILLQAQKQKVYITQLFIDNLIVLSVIITVGWFYLVERGSILVNLTMEELAIPLIFTSIQMSGVYTLFSIAITENKRKINKSLIIALISLSVHTTMNFLFMAINILNSSTSIFVDILWGVSLIGVGLSGLYPQQDDKLNEKSYMYRKILLFFLEIMPYFSVLLIIVIGILNWPNELPIIICGGIVITLLSLRQVINRLEKNGLINELEEKINDRTKNLQIKTKELEYLANRDNLTGLKNRRSLLDEVDQVLIEARNTGKKVGVLFIDIDDFKYINDILGHSGGDKLLMEVSKKFTENIDQERHQVFRNSGDEFVIILDNISNREDLKNFIEDFQMEICKDIVIDGYKIPISVSIGVAIYPVHGNNRESLLKAADVAMYETKKKGKHGFSIYNDSMAHHHNKKIRFKNDIDKAIEEKQFQLYYQPQYNLNAEKVVAVEALIRWIHPKKGFISPTDFIDIAEQTGQIHPIGKWVLQEACEQLKIWQDRGLAWKVSVNISPKQLFKDDFIELVFNIISETNIDPKYLELEITENIYINGEYSIMKLRKLKELGVSLAIDDFGTGYSSLQYLKELPIDVIKIDKLFIDGILNNLNDLSIIKGIITMAKTLDLKIIAEGVEIEKQMEVLKYLGCDMIQGYIIEKPIPINELEERYLHNKKMT
ncbi:bifunctional diguanylate cyclase/phosphodiesterase [Clostridium sp. D2Q-11]|uniref:Bifunctional diguanylate cyclase/phosphodiesterase n=1 Tax=Anaeromonas frigoriresistens TaxID=2683708 RepID=A0A942UUC4_9FIRM|nr:bifunctional diguanylate cyclase/phosphodiesterase [Anaeromonas frigoriresistens]MBS4538155.1 bifunctional diguanylate cyclase/phosphodiesterase [Anaeromonas frigoriresistens]